MMIAMRTAALWIALAAFAPGCKSKARAPEPEANGNPYRQAMPEKMKQKVEDAQKKEETRDDKLIDNAR